MTMVFPIEERSSTKMMTFPDFMGNKVAIAPRRMEWLKEQHGHKDDWWLRLSAQPRRQSDYFNLAPESRRLLVDVFDFTNQALATPFTAIRDGIDATYRNKIDGTRTSAKLPVERHIYIQPTEEEQENLWREIHAQWPGIGEPHACLAGQGTTWVLPGFSQVPNPRFPGFSMDTTAFSQDPEVPVFQKSQVSGQALSLQKNMGFYQGFARHLTRYLPGFVPGYNHRSLTVAQGASVGSCHTHVRHHQRQAHDQMDRGAHTRAHTI
jgi:hypothetical protein